MELNFDFKSIQVIDRLGNPTEKQNDGKGYVYYYFDDIGVDFVFMNSNDRMVSVAFRKNPTPDYVPPQKTVVVTKKKKESEREVSESKTPELSNEIILKDRFALIIGNSAYEHGSKLENRPINDAKDISARLNQLGFNV